MEFVKELSDQVTSHMSIHILGHLVEQKPIPDWHILADTTYLVILSAATSTHQKVVSNRWPEKLHDSIDYFSPKKKNYSFVLSMSLYIEHTYLKKREDGDQNEPEPQEKVDFLIDDVQR